MSGQNEGIKFPMFYLGVEKRESKKSGNHYAVAKFQKPDAERPEVFGFYVGDESLQNEIGVLEQFKKYELILTLSAFNNKPEVRLIGIGGEA